MANRTCIPLLLCSLLLWPSCKLVKERRDRCPAMLTLEVSGVMPGSVLTVSGDSYYARRPLNADTTLALQVPKELLKVVVASGAEPCFTIPPGQDCPPVFFGFTEVDVCSEAVLARVISRKHYCRIRLDMEGPPGSGEPFVVRLKGEVCGLYASGAPLSGEFCCDIDPVQGVCLPRQPSSLPLILQIVMPDRVIREFSLGEILLRSGYDWESADLEDLDLALKLSVTSLQEESSVWAEIIGLDVEI